MHKGFEKPFYFGGGQDFDGALLINLTIGDISFQEGIMQNWFTFFLIFFSKFQKPPSSSKIKIFWSIVLFEDKDKKKN